MFNNNTKLKLTDLIDIELLQELQDTFAKTMNVASIAVDDKGPITKPSNFTDFCIKYTRGTEEGYNRCNECDIKWGKIAAESGKPIIYDCHSGLRDFAVPIMVEGKHIASILGGQILTKLPDKRHFIQLAKELGINKNDYIKALKKIKIVPSENIDAAANFLYLVANTISKIAHKNLELIRKNEREISYRKITEAIRSSLEIEETLSYICSETAKLFNVQRTSISEFPDPYDYEKHITRMEYKHTFEMNGLDKLKYLSKLAQYFGKILNDGKILAVDNILNSNTPDYFKESYNILGVKSLLAIPIQKENAKWGILILSEYNDYRQWTNDEIELAKSIASQIYIAIYQAELHEKTKKQAEVETLLREIIEKIRGSLDVDETLSFICDETAKLFNVQRVALTTFPNPENYENFNIKKEYKISDDMPGFGFGEDSSKTAIYWANVLIEGCDIYFVDNIETSDTPDYFKNVYNSLGVKSIIGTSIRKGDDIWGTLVLSEYNYYRHWTKEEKMLLKTIANQIYIAINQAELFEQARKKAENQKAIREIMLSSANTFDFKEIIHTIVIETGKLFKADRCFYIEVDPETDTNLPIKDYAEYLSSKDIVSHIPKAPNKEETGVFIERVKKKEILHVHNIFKEDLPELAKKMLIDELSVKSYLVAPVYYGNKHYGAIVLHYTNNFNEFSQDELDMASTIANQSAVILHQAELYGITKVQAEREKISKNIIEILRSTLDKSIIKKLFVKNIGKLLEADRVLFSEYDYENKTYSPVDSDSEYLSDCNLNSFVGYDWSCEEAREYIQPLLERREFHIYNWDEYLPSNTRSQNFINLFERRSVKSSYSFPVMYQTKMIGFFSIGFIKQVQRLTNEDINRIRNLCTQAGIALYHADLYKEAQKSIQAHAEFVNKLSSELKEPLDMIVEFSSMKSDNESQCAEEIEHLNLINNNAQKLLYFLDDIKKNIKNRMDFH